MVSTRRHVLQMAGATTLTALAGCSATGVFGSGDATPEYSLNVVPIDVSPIEHALYEPGDGTLFGDPARTALTAVLPDGRHTTYGYKPLPSDAYVAHEGVYFQTKYIATGCKKIERQLVRIEPVPKEQAPENAILIDTLKQPSARPLKMLHSYTQTNGETSTTDLLRGDAYVLRRPAELESRLVTGNLNGRVMTMTESGTWAYRVHITHEQIVETAYTTLAVEMAASRDQFREVVFDSRIDAELTASDLPEDASCLVKREK